MMTSEGYPHFGGSLLRLLRPSLGVVQAGRECQCRGLFVEGTPTPWQVAAGSSVSAQVLGNYALVLRKVTRHGCE